MQAERQNLLGISGRPNSHIFQAAQAPRLLGKLTNKQKQSLKHSLSREPTAVKCFVLAY